MIRRFHLIAPATALCLVAFWLAPAGVAYAVEPPGNDSFLYPDNLNKPHTRLSANSTISDVKVTTAAGVQSNIFDPCGRALCLPGPPEVTTCHGVPYDKTVWYEFYPGHDGQVEIRTSGIPNVIALYTYDPQTFRPQEVQCAPGSSYASNDLFANVQRGVAYTYQLGGRHGAGGNLKMRFNYAYRSDLTVLPFFTEAVLRTIGGQSRNLKLLRLRVIGLAKQENASYGCAFCSQVPARTVIERGNVTVLALRPARVIGSRSRMIVAATSAAQIGRFKLYAIDVAHRQLRIVDQGCLAPGVTSVSAADAQQLAPPKRVPCPVRPVQHTGAEYVFWQGSSGRLWEKRYANHRWSASIKLSAHNLASAPAVAVHANGEQDVFWKGTDGNLWESWYTGAWRGPIKLAGEDASAPSAGVDAAGNEYVVWQGTDGGLWEKSRFGQSWNDQIELSSGTLGSAPALAIHPGGEQDVFWKGVDGNLWEMWYTNQWNGPMNLGGAPLGSGPTAGVDAAGNEYVFWQGPVGGLWEKFYLNGSWTGPIPLNAGKLGSGPSVSVHADGGQHVFWRGTDGDLWESWYSRGWHPPVDLAARRLASAPSAGVEASGKQTAG